jgi:PAS domain S-box-containing protein
VGAWAQGARVLMLVSYHPGMAWSDAQVKGVQEQLRSVSPAVDLVIEYLDTKRVSPSAEYYRDIETVVLRKVGQTPPALILASDDDALDLALQFRQRHFPQVPVLFSGVAISRKAGLETLANTGGVFDDLDTASSMEMVLRLLPRTQRVVVIHDQSRTSLAQMETLKAGLSARRDVATEYLSGLPVARIQDRLRQLGPQDLVFALPFNRDADGKLLSHEDAADLWAAASNAPVTVTRDVAMRPGILGGFLVSGLEQGLALGEQARLVLSGQTDSAFTLRTAPVQATFSYPQIQKWAVDTDSLPANTVLQGVPANPWDDLRPYAGWLAALIGSLLAIISLLLYGMRTRQVVANTLRQSEKNYRDLFTHSPDAILVQALPDGHTLEVNPRFVDMLGYSETEALHLSAAELRCRAEAGADAAEPETVLGNGEVRLQRKDGQALWAEVSSTELEVGATRRRVVTLRDISDRKHAETLAREMEHTIRQIYENLPIAVFAIDAQHRVTFWNRQMTRMTGIAASEVVGSTDSWRGIYPDKRPCLLDVLVDGSPPETLKRLYGDGLRASTQIPGALEGEGYFTNRDQTRGMWGRFCAAPLRNAEGAITGAIETMIDITPLKRIQTDLEELNRDLEARVEARNAELQRAMGQLMQSEKLAALGSLVAGVAHELNTPIGNVLSVSSALTEEVSGFTHKLLSGNAKRSDVDRSAQRLLEASALIERNATRAAKLISNFKDVAVDQASSRRRQFALREVVDEILHTAQPLFKGTTHQVCVTIPPDIALDSFPGPLEQVLINLLTNSVTHGFEGRSDGHIAIRAEQKDSRVELRYEDDGCGIPAHSLPHVFEPFYTTKLGRGGSGLGMYLVYNLVSNVLGGSIRVQSTPGEGTWIDITLPLVAPAGDT